MYGCAILEKVDYLCNLIGLQVLPHATSSDKNTGRSKVKDSLLGGCLGSASPLHLLSLSFVPKQVKLIHNDLCILNGQTDIPEA